MKALIEVAALLILAHVLLLLVSVLTGHDYIFGFVPLLDLDRERNIPSFFSGCLFLLNALLFALVAKASPRSTAISWSKLSGLFVFLAYDELFSLHELLTTPLRTALHTSGLLFYPWMLVYVPLVILLVWGFFPVWRHLEGPLRTSLGLAAGTYLLGAVGIEMVGGAYDEAFGTGRNLGWGLLVGLEESLEMTGLLILTHALLKLLAQGTGGATIVIGDRE
jgi:hypothetical protein